MTKKRITTKKELLNLFEGLIDRINKGGISKIKLGISFKLSRTETEWLIIVIAIAAGAIKNQKPLSLFVSEDDIKGLTPHLKSGTPIPENYTIVLYTILSYYFSMKLKERNLMVKYYLNLMAPKKATELAKHIKDFNKEFHEMIKGQEVMYGLLSPPFHKRYNELIELGWRKKINIDKKMIKYFQQVKK